MQLIQAVSASFFESRGTTTTTETYLRFSVEELTRRYGVVRALMQETDLAALLLFSTISSPYEVHYLSNFPTTWETLLVFPLEGEPTLLLELYNHVPNARQIASIAHVRWGGPHLVAPALQSMQQRRLPGSQIGPVANLPYQYDQTK